MPERVYDNSKGGRKLNASVVQLVKTDLKAGLTFARIAQQGRSDADTKYRNQTNARKAYDTILKWEKRLVLTEHDEHDIAEKLILLKSALIALGEEF